jgi:hypothetical protein
MNPSTPPSEIPSASGGRRDFLTILAGVAALSVVPFAAGFASRRRRTVPGGFTAVPPTATLPALAEFVPHIGSAFIASATGTQPTIRFTLAKAEALKQHQASAGEPFSLRFAAPAGHLIESRIYQLQHPVLGSLELFISPVGSADRFGEAQKGEAVINPVVRLS